MSVARTGGLLAALLLATPAAAQTREPAVSPGQMTVLMELQLADGSVLYGYVVRDVPDRIVFRTLTGTDLELVRADISELRPARGRIVDGRFQPYDSNTTRMLFAPTARSLPKGEGYVGVYELLLPFVQVGVTDRFSMGAGTPLLFVGDESGRPVWLTPKYQFYDGASTSAAAGVLHFAGIGSDSQVGIAYAVATRGGPDGALTLGGGWAYARYTDEQYPSRCATPGPPPMLPSPCDPIEVKEREGSPVVMLGGERRLGEGIKIVTENYAFQGGGVVAVGFRFLGDRLSADLGVFAPLGTEDVFVGPIVNFTWRFGP